MSDEALRGLERRVAANPTDFAASQELVRALERAGAKGRALDEQVRSARAGDSEARRRLDRMGAPRPNVRHVALRDGIRRPDLARLRQAELEVQEVAAPLGASDRTLYFLNAWATSAVDARSLAERWRAPSGLVTLAAVGHVFVGWSRNEAYVLDEQGTRIPAAPVVEHPYVIAALGRTAVAGLATPSGPRLAAFDLETRRELWSAPLPHAPVDLLPVPGRVAVIGRPITDSLRGAFPEEGGTLEVRDLETGAPLWSRDFDGGAELLGGDVGGFFVLHRGRIVSFDRDTARDVVFGDAFSTRRVGFDDDHVLVPRLGAVALHERGTARELWSVPFERGRTFDFLLAGEHAWLASIRDDGKLGIGAVSLADGLRIARWDVPFAIERQASVRLVPLDGAIVVVAVTYRRTLLIRIEE